MTATIKKTANVKIRKIKKTSKYDTLYERMTQLKKDPKAPVCVTWSVPKDATSKITINRVRQSLRFAPGAPKGYRWAIRNTEGEKEIAIMLLPRKAPAPVKKKTPAKKKKTRKRVRK